MGNKIKSPINLSISLSKGLKSVLCCLTRCMFFSSHEDGTVRFWNASGVCLQFMYKLSTSTIFKVDVHSPDPSGEMEEEWPPFKKVDC